MQWALTRVRRGVRSEGCVCGGCVVRRRGVCGGVCGQAEGCVCGGCVCGQALAGTLRGLTRMGTPPGKFIVMSYSMGKHSPRSLRRGVRGGGGWGLGRMASHTVRPQG